MSKPIPNCEIRAARPEDLPAAARLAAELIRFHNRLDPGRFGLMSDNIETGYERYLADRARAPDAVVLVAELDGQIVAYAFGQTEPRDWMRLLDAHGRVHDVIVAESARGSGVGRQIVERLISELRSRGATQILLETAWRNDTARAFFASLGFEPTLVEMTLR